MAPGDSFASFPPTAVAMGKPWKLPAIFTQAIKYSKALHQKVK